MYVLYVDVTSAIAQTSDVYFPPTSYIAFSRGKHIHEKFHDHFKWFKNGVTFNNFTRDTEPREIIKTLSRDVDRNILQRSFDERKSGFQG